MAKMIKFNLTLSGATVSTFDELQDNFSADILPIYRTGRLLKWLQARELTEQVQAVQAITPSDDDRELLGALCRALGLDDDAEVLTFLLEDWQASQQSQTAAQAAPAAQTDAAQQSAEEAEQESDDTAASAPAAEPVDWSGLDMSGRNFEGADLRNGIFVGTRFRECDFRGADLRGANFTKADLYGCLLSEADCTGADFTEAGLQIKFAKKVNFKKAKFIKTEFPYISSSGGYFWECDFGKARIFAKINTYMIACDFSQADLSNSEINQWLTGSNFHEANLSFVKFDQYQSSRSIIDASWGGTLIECGLSIFGDIKISREMKNPVNFEKSQMLGVVNINKSTADAMTENYKNLKSNQKK